MKVEEGKPKDIRQRAFAYALRAIKLYQALAERKDGAAWVLGRQYLKSATSVGANIEEAQSGETRADYIHKYGIAQKEAQERGIIRVISSFSLHTSSFVFLP